MNTGNTPQGQYVQQAQALLVELRKCEADIFFMKPEKRLEIHEVRANLQRYIATVAHPYSPLRIPELPAPLTYSYNDNFNRLQTPVYAPTTLPTVPITSSPSLQTLANKIYKELYSKHYEQLKEALNNSSVNSLELFLDKYMPPIEDTLNIHPTQHSTLRAMILKDVRNQTQSVLR